MGKYYTIGEIYRLGLLLNHKGKPYAAKATVSRIVSKMKSRLKKTPHGIAKQISMVEINKHNSQWK